jgi:hypothetical protein
MRPPAPLEAVVPVPETNSADFACPFAHLALRAANVVVEQRYAPMSGRWNTLSG